MSTRLSETIASLHETRSVDLSRGYPYREDPIDAEGAIALADALKENKLVTDVNLSWNEIGAEGASALADALKVNTSVTNINLGYIGEAASAPVRELIARNNRLRHLFLFDARPMLLSLMCADECGVAWPYLLESGDTDGIVAPNHIETLRAQFAAVVEERRRRAAIAVTAQQ
jgi:hypothetical protein